MANQLWRAETNARPLDKDSRGAVRPKPSATTAVNATTLEECLASYAHLHLLHMSGGCRLVGTGPSLPSGPAVCERATPVPARCPCTRRHLAAHVRRYCCFTVDRHAAASLPPPLASCCRSVLPKKRVFTRLAEVLDWRPAYLTFPMKPALCLPTRLARALAPHPRPRTCHSAKCRCHSPRVSLSTRLHGHADQWWRLAECRLSPLPTLTRIPDSRAQVHAPPVATFDKGDRDAAGQRPRQPPPRPA